MPTPKLIKRYAESRLYDTQDARYLDAGEVAAMARLEDVLVLDAASGQDVTRGVMAEAARTSR